jgi:hypothetical protein
MTAGCFAHSKPSRISLPSQSGKESSANASLNELGICKNYTVDPSSGLSQSFVTQGALDAVRQIIRSF